MVKEAVEAGAHTIMLDNMTHKQLEEAINYIDGRAEVSFGNITRENIAKLTDLGVDYISSGALTHSAPILDISLKNLHQLKNKQKSRSSDMRGEERRAKIKRGYRRHRHQFQG